MKLSRRPLCLVAMMFAGCSSVSPAKHGVLFRSQQIRANGRGSPVYVLCRDVCSSPSAKTIRNTLQATKNVTPAIASSTESPSPAQPKDATPVWTGSFELASARLSDEDKASLRERLDEIQGNGLEIHGFTDAIGGASINQWLSYERAKAVASYLVTQGLDADSIVLQTHPRCCALERGLSFAEAASQEERKAEIYINNRKGRKQ